MSRHLYHSRLVLLKTQHTQKQRVSDQTVLSAFYQKPIDLPSSIAAACPLITYMFQAGSYSSSATCKVQLTILLPTSDAQKLGHSFNPLPRSG